MVKLRLTRLGKIKVPFYRIVVMDSKKQRDGEHIDLIGTYDPLNEKVKIKHEKALKWLSNGVQPTDKVRSILSNEGILQKFHEQKLLLKKSQPKKIKKATVSKTVTKKNPTKSKVKVEKPAKSKVVKTKTVS